MPSHVRLLGQPLRSASQKLLQQRTVFPSALVNFGIALLTAIVLLSFFSCDLHTAGDAKDIAIGSAATRAVSDVGSICGVADKAAGVDGADRSRRHRGAVGVAGNATDEEVGESAGGDASGIAIGAVRDG